MTRREREVIFGFLSEGLGFNRSPIPCKEHLYIYPARFHHLEKPHVQFIENVVNAKIGEKVDLEATVRGLPKPKTTLKKDDTVIQADKNVIIQERDGSATLAGSQWFIHVIFKKVEQNHSGEYSLLAENIHGTATAFVRLNIQGLMFELLFLPKGTLHFS